MLGSNICNITNLKEKELADVGECLYDPRGYFVIKGVEKAVQI